MATSNARFPLNTDFTRQVYCAMLGETSGSEHYTSRVLRSKPAMASQ
jgi:hypothetical protein